MRIISGKYRSRIIKYPNLNSVKPTADNVREAVFNMLGPIDDLIVLDLFSGSGSYGLEALSRGANTVYFNDFDNKSIQIIKENIKSLNEQDNSKLTNLDYLKALSLFQKSNILFDLIFLDPPYFKDYYDKAINESLLLLNKGGKIVIEIDKNVDIDFIISKYIIEKDRSYGRKRIIIINVN